MVTSCLNYCNALLIGLPACAVKSWYMIQNIAACLVSHQPKNARDPPACWPLLATHRFLIQIQITNATYSVIQGLNPSTWTQSYRLMLLLSHCIPYKEHRLASLSLQTRQSQYKVNNSTDGTSEQTLSEQGSPSLSSRISWWLISSKSASSS